MEKLKVTVANLEQLHGFEKRTHAISTDFGMLTATKGEERKPFIILGVRYATIILADNQSNGENPAIRQFTVDLLEGTVEVVTLFRGFFRLYGDIHFNDNLTDHHFGLDWVNIRTVGVFHGTAFFEAQMLLRDGDGDDNWSGVMGAVIFCLGHHPS